MADAIGLRRIPPADGAEHGTVMCDHCGRRWPTTVEEDRLLADIFEHAATHGRPATGSAPSSATPDISTR